MNVGIMSMQRIFNYGSWMQAYCLSNLISEQGHHVEFVDYHIGKPKFKSSKERLGYYARYLKHAAEEKISDSRFLSRAYPNKFLYNEYCFKQNSLKSLLGGDLSRQYDKEIDCLVIGSDEVFNCLQCSPRVGFSPELLGEYSHAKKRISYAASFGNTTIERINESGRRNDIVRYLSNLDCISVRDENSRSIIYELLGIEPEINLDPVLMWDCSSLIEKNTKPDEAYMIVYTYPGRLTHEEGVEIKKYAEKNSLKIYGINAQYGFLDRMVYGSPIEVINYFANAKCVVADTFHGTLFSIINHKPFVSIVRDSNNGRYGNSQKLKDVLSRLNLENRIVPCIDQLGECMTPIIQYDSVDKVILRERQHAREYLLNSIS